MHILAFRGTLDFPGHPKEMKLREPNTGLHLPVDPYMVALKSYHQRL